MLFFFKSEAEVSCQSSISLPVFRQFCFDKICFIMQFRLKTAVNKKLPESPASFGYICGQVLTQRRCSRQAKLRVWCSVNPIKENRFLDSLSLLVARTRRDKS